MDALSFDLCLQKMVGAEARMSLGVTLVTLGCQKPGNCDDNTPNASISEEGGTTLSILHAIEYFILTKEKIIIVADQVVRLAGFLWTRTWMLGGTMGVRVKS
jgi:hypothetical protein